MSFDQQHYDRAWIAKCLRAQRSTRSLKILIELAQDVDAAQTYRKAIPSAAGLFLDPNQEASNLFAL